MRICFWSSVEATAFMQGLIRQLTEGGFEAQHCFQISEASYRSAKSAPARLFLRFRQYLAYPVQLIAALVALGLKAKSRKLDEEGGVCVVSTNTFYAPLLATYLHPNVVHLVYDLFPEAMIHSGKWTEGTLKVKLVRWITKQTLKRAKTNVFLGQRLKEYVESIHGSVANAAIIPIGADQALFSQSPVERRSLIPQSSPTIIYCGNFGNMHDSATMFDNWKRSDEQGNSLQWVFHCSGPKQAELEAVLSAFPAGLKKQIHLGGGLDQVAWIAAMESADVGLVTMVPGSETVVMPSKTYSAMMAGQAILAIAPEDSDLVDLIKAADCGWFVAPGDVAGLAVAIDLIGDDPEGLLEKRENAYRYAHKHFGQDSLARKWVKVFTSL